jgi:hypothetical protein
MINHTLEAMETQGPDQPSWHQKRKAISALLLYALRQEPNPENAMFGGLLRAARASAGLLWIPIRPLISMLFDEINPWTMVFVSPHVDWGQLRDCENLVSQWAAAVSAVPRTQEVSRSVVDTLLHIASVDSLRSHIPVGIWAWLDMRPSLPPVCFGRPSGTGRNVVQHIRKLGDVKILKSYFLLVWSEWDPISDPPYQNTVGMQVSIWEDFSGLEAGPHRKDLINRLDHVLEQLDRGLEYLKQHKPSIDERHLRRAKEDYTKLKEVLLEVDREAVEILTRMPLRRIILSVC